MNEPVLSRGGRFALNLLLILTALAAVLWLIVQLRLVVLPVGLALALSTVLWPLVRRLRDRGLPPALATGAVMLGAFAVLAGGVAALVPTVGDEIDDVGQTARSGVEQVVTWLTDGPLDLSKEQIDGAIDDGVEGLRSGGAGIGTRLVSGAVLVAEVIAGLLLAIVVTFFMLKDGGRMRGFFEERLPQHRRASAAAAAEAAWDTLGGYLRGIAIVGLVDSILIGIVLWLLGVPLVIPLMVLTFFAAFVPLVGAVVAGAVAALVALVSQGPLIALAVVAAIIAIQQIEGDLLYPVVVGRAIELHPVAILLVLTGGSVTAGVIGALVAVPVAGAAWSAWTAWQAAADPPDP